MSSSLSVPLCALLLLAILPIWLFTYLPMTDLPEHMLIAKILTSYNDPQFDFSENFTTQIPWKPYSTYFWLTSLLAPLTGIPIATKLYITATFLLSIVAFGVWVRTVAPGQGPNVLVAVPLLYGVFFYIGVINYLFSIPFLFFALALGWKIGNSRATGLEKAALSGALLAIWFSHPVTFALALMLLSAQAVLLLRGRNLPSLVAAGAPSAVVIVMYAFWSASSDVASFAWAYEPLKTRLAVLLLPFGIFQDHLSHKWVLLPGVALFWSGFIVCAAAARLLTKEKTDRAGYSAVMLVAVLLTAAAILLPSTFAGGLGIAMLAAQPAAYALIAVVPTNWYQSRTLRYLTISGCAIALAVIGFRFWQFQPEMRDFERAIAVIPPKQRIQPIITEPHTPYLETYPFLHVSALYGQWKGGISPYLFTKVAHFPVRERSKAIPNPPGEWSMGAFRYEANQAATDYFIVRTRDIQILADLAKNVPLAVEAGEWKVFGPNK